jgi:hypothetical protein
MFFLAACAASPSPTLPAPALAPGDTPLDPTYEALIAAQRDPDVPELPFADNPDPSLCGIPTRWGKEDPAWLTGIYEGELLQETVLLYDSHLRMHIVARAPHGTQVKVLLFQQNPNLDYYLVKVEEAPLPNEGWIPAPFLSFSPVVPLSS